MAIILNMQRVKFVVLVGAFALTGCASSLVGYEAETEHTCPRTKGVGCTPVSEVYKRAMEGALPGQKQSGGVGQMTPPSENLASVALRPVLTSGMPVRTAPRVLRIWFAPWKDGLDVLHDQRHSYLTLDHGRWLIEHNQQRLFQQFSATRLIQGGVEDDAPRQPAAPKAPASAPAITPGSR